MTSTDDAPLRALQEHSSASLIVIDSSIHRARHSQDCQPLYESWNQLLAAERSINSAKAAQLNRTADIFERHPTLLKRLSDPSQLARENAGQIVSWFKTQAEKARPTRRLKRAERFKATPGLRHSYLPILPFDSYLRLFCRRVRENPVSRPTVGSKKWRPYPVHIARDIEIVIAGLAYVFTVPEPGSKREPSKILRTKNTNYSAPTFRGCVGTAKAPPLSTEVDNDVAKFDHWKPINQNVAHVFLNPRPEDYDKRRLGRVQVTIPFAEPACPDDCWNAAHKHPIFLSPPYPHLGKLFSEKENYHLGTNWAKHLPHHEKEFEWLEAFLRVVTYLQRAENEDPVGTRALGSLEISHKLDV